MSRSGIGRSILGSLRFLTVLPVPMGRSAAAPDAGMTGVFPLAGLAIGLLLLPLAFLPVDPFVRAALILVAWSALTGGLHEDGWIDAMDATLAPVDRRRRLEILKDPRVGAHGMTALLCLVFLRYGALVSVPAAALVAAPVVGRWTMVLSLARFPALRAEGLGAAFADGARPLAAGILAGAVLIPLAALVSSAWPVVVWVVGTTAGLVMGRFLTGRLGGLNGDGHGAVGLLAETASLVAWSMAPASLGWASWSG